MNELDNQPLVLVFDGEIGGVKLPVVNGRTLHRVMGGEAGFHQLDEATHRKVPISRGRSLPARQNWREASERHEILYGIYPFTEHGQRTFHGRTH